MAVCRLLNPAGDLLKQKRKILSKCIGNCYYPIGNWNSLWQILSVTTSAVGDSNNNVVRNIATMKCWERNICISAQFLMQLSCKKKLRMLTCLNWTHMQLQSKKKHRSCIWRGNGFFGNNSFVHNYVHRIVELK